MSRPSIRRRSAAAVGVAALIGAATVQSTSAEASAEVDVVTTSFTAHNGEVFTATNHLVKETPKEADARGAHQVGPQRHQPDGREDRRRDGRSATSTWSSGPVTTTPATGTPAASRRPSRT